MRSTSSSATSCEGGGDTARFACQLLAADMGCSSCGGQLLLGPGTSATGSQGWHQGGRITTVVKPCVAVAHSVCDSRNAPKLGCLNFKSCFESGVRQLSTCLSRNIRKKSIQQKQHAYVFPVVLASSGGIKARDCLTSHASCAEFHAQHVPWVTLLRNYQRGSSSSTQLLALHACPR